MVEIIKCLDCGEEYKEGCYAGVSPKGKSVFFDKKNKLIQCSNCKSVNFEFVNEKKVEKDIGDLIDLSIKNPNKKITLGESKSITIAETILKQLGGNKFIAMTRARDFVSGEGYLNFKIPSTKKGINQVTIELTEMDVYIMEFKKRVGLADWKIIKTVDNVYFDQLQEVFTETTGLNCSL